MRGCIPKMAMNTCHVAEVNQKSLSGMMSWGSPCSLQISRANTLARCAAVFYPTASRMKCAILENLSIITHSSSHPSESGRHVMKSMASDSHGTYASSSGDSSPYRLWRLALSCWQVGHDCIYPITWAFIPDHQKFRPISSRVLSCPK